MYLLRERTLNHKNNIKNYISFICYFVSIISANMTERLCKILKILCRIFFPIPRIIILVKINLFRGKRFSKNVCAPPKTKADLRLDI